MVHLGIEKGMKMYRLLDPKTGSIYVSRNIVFEERGIWSWEANIKMKSTPGINFTVEGFNISNLEFVEIRSISSSCNDTEYRLAQNNDAVIESMPQPITSQINSYKDPQPSPKKIITT